MGKLSDMFGAKRLFIAGLVLVAIACLFAPFSVNYGMLLSSRALQAIGSSTLFPSGMIIVCAQITKKQARAIANVSDYTSTSAAFATTVDGFLITDW